MELIYRKNYTIEAIHTDRFGRAKPSTLLYLAQDTAGAHCKALSVDPKKNGLFWAVIRTKVQVTRLPVIGQNVTVETWPLPTTRVAYPRCVVAYDDAGNELFRAVSLWVLMDRKTRAMILPGKSGVDVPGLTRGTELAAPNALALHPRANRTERTVRYAQLDGNGHMNNTRYLEWVEDVLPSDFHRERAIREFTICYMAEALEGQQIRLDWELQEDGVLRLDGLRRRPEDPEKTERVFSVSAQY